MTHAGQVLRNFRAKHNLTQAELAERIGIEPRTLARWETGDRILRNIDELYRLCDLLGIPPHAFGLQPFRNRSAAEIETVVQHTWSLMPLARYREARETIENLLRDIHVENADKAFLLSLARAYHIAGHVVAVNTRTHEVGLAIDHFQRMEDLAREIEDDSALNIALTYHGDMLRRKGDVSEASEYLKGARDTTPEADVAVLGNNLQLLARTSVLLGDMQEFDRSMKTAEEIAATMQSSIWGGSFGLGTVYEEFGKTYARQGELEKSLHYLALAEQHFPAAPRWNLVVKTTRAEALVYGGELEEGLKQTKEAIQQALQQGHLRLLERAYGIRKYLKQRELRFGKAAEELTELLEGQIEH